MTVGKAFRVHEREKLGVEIGRMDTNQNLLFHVQKVSVWPFAALLCTLLSGTVLLVKSQTLTLANVKARPSVLYIQYMSYFETFKAVTVVGVGRISPECPPFLPQLTVEFNFFILYYIMSVHTMTTFHKHVSWESNWSFIFYWFLQSRPPHIYIYT